MALVTLKTMPFTLGSSYTLVVVPMFILMGLVASAAGIMTDLYNSLNRWLARFRGSLLLVTTGASAAFGAVSGSTIVNATVFTRIAFPEMVRLGYKPGVGAAAIACAGTLASLIPPSLCQYLTWTPVSAPCWKKPPICMVKKCCCTSIMKTYLSAIAN